MCIILYHFFQGSKLFKGWLELKERLDVRGKRVQTEHPDVNPEDPKAAERFQELVAAYNAVMGSWAGANR